LNYLAKVSILGKGFNTRDNYSDALDIKKWFMKFNLFSNHTFHAHP
jgi:hypothetical protein